MPALSPGVGLTQKACLMRAGMWLRAVDWGRVERPALGWARWLKEVRFRGRLRRQRWGRVAAGGHEMSEASQF